MPTRMNIYGCLNQCALWTCLSVIIIPEYLAIAANMHAHGRRQVCGLNAVQTVQQDLVPCWLGSVSLVFLLRMGNISKLMWCVFSAQSSTGSLNCHESNSHDQLTSQQCQVTTHQPQKKWAPARTCCNQLIAGTTAFVGWNTSTVTAEDNKFQILIPDWSIPFVSVLHSLQFYVGDCFRMHKGILIIIQMSPPCSYVAPKEHNNII